MIDRRRVWILGAPDPEMAEIEAVLREHGEEVVYATVDGKRVHAGNAYTAADPFQYQEGDGSRIGSAGGPIRHPYRPKVLVECRPCGIGEDPVEEVTVVDHHFPGNHGYGKSPLDFFEASSLGQVLLFVLGEQTEAEKTCPNTPAHHPGVVTQCGHCGYVARYLPTREQRYIAAADHCLLAAYQGECPGIDPDELLRFRVRSRAAFRKNSEEQLLRDVEAARTALRSAPKRVIAGISVAILGTDIIPELPEAGCRDGIPYISFAPDRNDGRAKEMVEAAPPEVVAAWIEDAKARGLKDIYGDPARGFAGGYPS